MNGLKLIIGSLALITTSSALHAQDNINLDQSAENLRTDLRFQLENFAKERGNSIENRRLDIRFTPEGLTATAPLFDSNSTIDLAAGHDIAVFFISPSNKVEIDLAAGIYALRVVENLGGNHDFQVINSRNQIIDVMPANVSIKVLGDQANSDFDQAQGFIEIISNDNNRGSSVDEIGGSMHGRAWSSNGTHGDFWFDPD